MDYTVDEKDIALTVQDFETFCSYFTTKKVALTPKCALGKNDCFDLNSRMARPVPNIKNTYLMQKYPTISLYLTIALKTGLLDSRDTQKAAITTTESYAEFQQMSIYSKYLFLFLAWMRYIDVDAQYGDFMNTRWFSTLLIEDTFEYIKKAQAPTIINRVDRHSLYSVYVDERPLQELMHKCSLLLHHFRDLGLIEFDDEDVVIPEYSLRPVVNKLHITKLGAVISAACYTRRFSWINILHKGYADNYPDDYDEDVQEIYKNDFNQNLPGTSGFFKPFEEYFPEHAIDADTINHLLFQQSDSVPEDMIYEFRVSFARDCYRVIQCGSNHTFDDLHLVIQHAFNFDNDHLYAFFMDGKRWSNNSINSPYSDEPPFADDVRIGGTYLRVKQKFLYLFDFGDEWLFNITLQSVRVGELASPWPIITESVGKAPDQYPSYDGEEDWDDSDDEEILNFINITQEDDYE